MTKESPKQNIIVAVSSMQALWINIGLICYHNKPLSVQFLLFLDLPEKSKKKERKKHSYMLSLFTVPIFHFPSEHCRVQNMRP